MVLAVHLAREALQETLDQPGLQVRMDIMDIMGKEDTQDNQEWKDLKGELDSPVQYICNTTFV